MKDKLESAIEEALDDETYRKVKRMSYQSHNADEVSDKLQKGFDLGCDHGYIFRTNELCLCSKLNARMIQWAT